MPEQITKGKREKRSISMTTLITLLVTGIVLMICVIVMFIFIQLFRQTMEQNAVTSSEQAVVQVKNTVGNYSDDMQEIMNMIRVNIMEDPETRNEFLTNLLTVRADVVAITIYDETGTLTGSWTGSHMLKEEIRTNLSLDTARETNQEIVISSPHVETIFADAYPWVVTISQQMINQRGESNLVCMDIQFSNIADYVDDVGIGPHGYCFIIDEQGKLIYHPQQKLIYYGLKSEETDKLSQYKDGSYVMPNVIYNIHSLDNSKWRIVGVAYVDEMINNKVHNIYSLMVVLFLLVVLTAIITGACFSKMFTRPANSLAKAMGEFEKETRNFTFLSVKGTSEINSLSDSFGHMVLRIQRLMEQVRQEEKTLRKTELNALQAQINPHFLYNTLDSIAWMCEEGRTTDAIDMVNALARLFRISISKGHEMITIEKELQHAESYLKIQKFRYKNHFNFYLDVEPSCKNYLCSKIMLQPIIENAIVHGLDMEEEGSIYIRVYRTDGEILLVVEDNGVGMTEKLCNELVHREAGDKAGIGIKNVNDRIQIYFGEAYGLQIRSELDVGTVVEIHIPQILSEEELDGKV